MMYKGVLILTVLTALGVAQIAKADSAAPPVTISNGLVRVTFSPATGRITDFGMVHGENLLWQNNEASIMMKKKRGKWPNYGGDKLWAVPSMLWPTLYGSHWPIENALDGWPWKITHLTDSEIRVQSEIYTSLGLCAEREIRLQSGKPALTIKNTIKRVYPSPFPVQLWEVTQIKMPLYSMMKSCKRNAPLAVFEKKPSTVTMIEGGIFQVNHSQGTFKTGCLGEGLAAIFPEVIFIQTSSFDPLGSYPDGASIEIYSDASFSYVEMETLGSCVALNMGESISNEVQWTLIPVRSNLGESEAANFLKNSE
jgi:hypothetical protein